MDVEDLVGLVLMAVIGLLFAAGSVLRVLRQLRAARPGETPRTERRPPRPPPVARAPVAPPAPLSARRTTMPPQRKPAPTLEARVLRNRRLSVGARLIVASEILAGPKALRRGR